MISERCRETKVALFIIACTTFVVDCSTLGQAEGRQLSQQAVAELLRHQESLVRNIECVFERTTSPTKPENIPLIHEVGKIRDYDWDYQGFILDEEFTNQEALVTHYWRKGSKELQHVYHQSRYAADVGEIDTDKKVAFDGQLVRRLSRDRQSGQLLGEINTPKRGHWSNNNRIQPRSFLYEFEVMPYSTLIAHGKNFASSKILRNGKEYTKVSIQHPILDWRSFVLIFDDRFRLVERDVIARIAPDTEPRLYEKHLFLNYNQHRDESGETIWFPRKAVYHYYMGNLPDGTPVEFKSRTIEIQQIKFNTDVPDDKFTIEFPPGTRIWDGVSGLGWIDEPAQRTVDEVLSQLIEDVPDKAQPADTEEPDVSVHPDDAVVPASEIPLAHMYDTNDERGSKWWALAGLVVGLLVLATSMVLLIRAKKGSAHS